MCSHHHEMCRDESFYYKEINKQIQDIIYIGFPLRICFIDGWSQTQQHIDDPTEQVHYQEETKKLWDFGQNHADFSFKTIDQLKEEIECLNDIIAKNITDMQGKHLLICIVLIYIKLGMSR